MPGAALRAFFLPARLAIFQTAQPMTALRRLTMPTAAAYPRNGRR
jgi:hypothetical protein